MISLALWIFSDKITEYILGENKPANNPIEINYEKIQVLAFSIVG
jgi:hypothetical protein